MQDSSLEQRIETLEKEMAALKGQVSEQPKFKKELVFGNEVQIGKNSIITWKQDEDPNCVEP